MSQHRLLILSAIAFSVSGTAWADVYVEQVRPFTTKYCNRCHNEKQARGELDLRRYRTSSDVTRDFRRWSHVIEFVRNAEMPPADAEQQPTPDERNKLVAALETILLAESEKHAGDPGVILPRRLSNTEYDLSVRDLTGVDIRPTREFPADPAAGEGFDNTGEALSMTPSLLRKYLAAAQHVSNHVVLKTEGVTFAPFPVTSYNERKKLTEQAILDFYSEHEVRVLDYLRAAWRFRYRDRADRPLKIKRWAERHQLSGKYLALVWSTLSEASSESGYLKQLGDLWNAIPAPSDDRDDPRELKQLEQFIAFSRSTLNHREGALIKSNAGNWPISHLDFRATTAANRDRFDLDNFQSRLRVRFDRTRVAKGKNEESAETLYLRLDPVGHDDQDHYVILHRPIFSKSGDPPRNDKDVQKQEVVTLRSVLEQHAPELAARLSFGKHPKGGKLDADSLVVRAPAVIEIPLNTDALAQAGGKHLLVECELDPQYAKNAVVLLQHSTRKRPDDSQSASGELLIHRNSAVAKDIAAAAERICFTFPNRFFYVNSQRGLAAGFHLVEGFFRDDQPLVQKVLIESELRELNQLWEELDFVTRSAETLLRGFVWFERSERHVLHDKRFDFLRPEDPKLVEPEMLERFERVYLEKMGVKLVKNSLKAEQPDDDKYVMIHGFFEQIRKGLARREALVKAAEQQAFLDLNRLAERAYQRPLREGEVDSLRSLYRKLRAQGQDVEQSLRGVFTAILMSPEFCYRYTQTPASADLAPLPDSALASRLSYFLWSSLPDDELLAGAANNELQDEKVLLSQTKRMLQSEKLNAFSREFFAQWLRYRDYLSKDSINGDAFAGYTDVLKQAMFEEPMRVATHLIQNDRPITELLNTDTTFVNGVLAKHYDGDIARQYRSKSKSDDQWVQIDGLRSAGRGGLFGMGVILTKNSRGERTSPVRRGFWTVHHLLGQHFPPPPTDIPELPPNEREAKATIRNLLKQHTAHPQCAMCHKHFDSLGLALEGFGPTGKSRTKDLANRPIDNVAKLPSGNTAKGVAGLIEYIEEHRRDDFVRNFCKKFLGYALGRSVMLSDQPLLREMKAALERNEYRFSVLFETVVLSPQFRKQRGREFVAR